jgi:hypothetical protein
MTNQLADDPALESAVEHVQQIRVSMRLRRTENFKPRFGTTAYHVDAAEDALQRHFQKLAAASDSPASAHVDRVMSEYHRLLSEKPERASFFLYGAAVALGTTVKHLLDEARS